MPLEAKYRPVRAIAFPIDDSEVAWVRKTADGTGIRLAIVTIAAIAAALLAIAI